MAEETIKKARLEDGTICIYDRCCQTRKKESYEGFTFIGRGVVDSINGVMQKADYKYYFFRKKEITEEEKTWTESEVNQAIKNAIAPYEDVIRTYRISICCLAMAAVLAVILVVFN